MNEKNAQIKKCNATQVHNQQETMNDLIEVDENEQVNESLNDINCNTQNLNEIVSSLKDQAKSSIHNEASNGESN